VHLARGACERVAGREYRAALFQHDLPGGGEPCALALPIEQLDASCCSMRWMV